MSNMLKWTVFGPQHVRRLNLRVDVRCEATLWRTWEPFCSFCFHSDLIVVTKTVGRPKLSLAGFVCLLGFNVPTVTYVHVWNSEIL